MLASFVWYVIVLSLSAPGIPKKCTATDLSLPSELNGTLLQHTAAQAFWLKAAMPPKLVSSYQSVKKPNAEGILEEFHSLRAIGLGQEKAWKLCRDIGFSSVDASKVATVDLLSPRGSFLQVLENRQWVQRKAATLELELQDSEHSCKLMRAEREFLQSLGVNVWAVDSLLPSRTGSFDLLGDGPLTLVTGKLWVELKAWSANGFSGKFKELRDTLPEKLRHVHAKDETIGAAMLLAAKMNKAGTGWSFSGLQAVVCNWKVPGFRDLSPGVNLVPQGKVGALLKKPLGEIWPDVEFHTDPPSSKKGKKTLGLLSDFLVANDLDGGNAGKRAASFNQQLQQKKLKGRLRYLKISGKRGGPKFWLGSKHVLGLIQKHCL